MTIIYALLMLVMLAFAGLQYNDQDGIYWAVIYLVPAIALGFAAFAPGRFSTITGRILLALSVVILASGVYVYWPSKADFWNTPAWWDAEPVREGLGVAIAYLFTCTTIPLAFRRSVRSLSKQKVKQQDKYEAAEFRNGPNVSAAPKSRKKAKSRKAKKILELEEG